jgi:hypothetical protein
MAARTARKRIHFLRAAYNEGVEPDLPLAALVRRALRGRSVTETQVAIARVGVIETRQRHMPNSGFIKLALGAGTPEEAISTMGLDIPGEDDADQVRAPPRNRAFKMADAFCLIEGNELLVIVDGMRVGAVAQYLRLLLSAANQPAQNSAFELHPVGNPSKEDVLNEEGVSALKLTGTAFAAEAPGAIAPGAEATGMVERMWSTLLGQLRDVFLLEADDATERDQLAQSWGDLKVTTTIRARGGSRASPVVLEGLQDLSLELIEDNPVGMNILIETGRGSKVSPDELVLGKYITASRLERRNDLSILDMWGELEGYRAELREQRRWNV